jgi:hypothetical protein
MGNFKEQLSGNLPQEMRQKPAFQAGKPAPRQATGGKVKDARNTGNNFF